MQPARTHRRRLTWTVPLMSLFVVLSTGIDNQSAARAGGAPQSVGDDDSQKDHGRDKHCDELGKSRTGRPAHHHPATSAAVNPHRIAIFQK